LCQLFVERTGMERTQVNIARKQVAATRRDGARATVHRQSAKVMRVLQSDAADPAIHLSKNLASSFSNNNESLLSRQCDECAEEVQKKSVNQLPAIASPAILWKYKPSASRIA